MENPLDFLDPSFRVMEEKFLEAVTLGEDASEEYYLNREEAAYAVKTLVRDLLHGIGFRDPKYQEMRKAQKEADENYNAEAWFRHFRSIGISKRILEADLVLVPEKLYDKVKAELPTANVTILEKPSTNRFLLNQAADQRNAPRVIIRGGNEDKRWHPKMIDD
jgi:hypothetical protein